MIRLPSVSTSAYTSFPCTRLVRSRQLDRGQSGENRAGEAAHRPGLRQEPAEQSVRGRQLVSDDRGAQRDRVRLVDHLAPALAGAVEVESIGRILLAIEIGRAHV